MSKNKNIRLFRHLLRADRDEIEILLGKGYARAEIAQTLKVNKSTISREIGRRKRKTGQYDAAMADHKARVSRLLSKYQGMKVEAYPSLRKQIVRMLLEHRSPDEIAGRLKREKQGIIIGKDAIYRWLYSVWGQRYCGCLCTRRRRKKRQKIKERREMIPARIPLSMRPLAGVHGEADLFVSPKRAETPISVAVVCEQDSKFLWGRRIPNRKPVTMAGAMQEMQEELKIDTLTLDNGIENKDHQIFGVPAFFCDPHAPWQKPLVEQSIGLLRRWFLPKGTNLRRVPEELLQKYLATLNHKYRKSLGYRNAYEAAMERGILKTKIPAETREQQNVERVAFEVRI